jgi:hypothetical protein
VLRHCVWSRNIKNRCSIYIYDTSNLRVKIWYVKFQNMIKLIQQKSIHENVVTFVGYHTQTTQRYKQCTIYLIYITWRWNNVYDIITKWHKERRNVHHSSEANTGKEKFTAHFMTISITFKQTPQKKSAFRKAEKYIIFLANMALILQIWSYLLRYSSAKVKRRNSYNNHDDIRNLF